MKNNQLLFKTKRKENVFFTSGITHKYILSIGLLSSIFLILTCGKDQKTELDPCQHNYNEWFINYDKPNKNLTDSEIPIYKSGDPVEIEIQFNPRAQNDCPILHTIEVELFQRHFQSPGNWEYRSISTLVNDQVNAKENYIFNTTIIPPNPGTYYIRAKALESSTNVLEEKFNVSFHVQHEVNQEHLVLVGIGSPYNGQKIERGTELRYQYWFDKKSFGSYYAKVELQDGPNNTLHTLKEINNLSDFNSGSGFLNTNIPGAYSIRAAVWHRENGSLILSNVVVHFFEII